MTGSHRLEFVLDGPDELARLRQFRAGHPDVLIGDGGFGTWQALIPEVNGETVVTRYTLRELLDRLVPARTGRGQQRSPDRCECPGRLVRPPDGRAGGGGEQTQAAQPPRGPSLGMALTSAPNSQADTGWLASSASAS